jgi:Uma2 family endonuclease
MGTVTLPQSRPLTAVDLATMPDDGHRYELVDGTLVVTPSPSRRHQLVSGRLYAALTAACPADLLVLAAPLDVKLADDTVMQPDLLVVERRGYDDENRPLRPLLVVEILSPSTRHVDLTLKPSRYAAAGTPAYWVVDPDEPSLTAWAARRGGFEQVAHAAGDESVELIQPYAVRIRPADLLR